jgi:hypothetical protein
MKKIILASILALAAGAASAQVSAVASYEANVVANSAVNTQEVLAGVNVGLGNGFAAQALGIGDYNRGEGVSASTGTGWLIGGTKTFSAIYGVTPTIGLGYGHTRVDTGTQLNFIQATAEGRYPIAQGTNLVVGYRFRQGEFVEDYFRSNRVSVGVEKQLSKALVLGVQAQHTAGEGYISNGVGASVAYTF